jgi:hypothetical protein
MTDDRFEGLLRATLVAHAPADVPGALEARVRTIPLAAAPRLAWLPGPLRRPLPLVGLAATLVLALGLAGFVAIRSGPPTAGGGSNAVSVSSDFGTFKASDFALVIDGRRIDIPSPGEPGVQTFSFAGSATFGQLTVAWRAGDAPYVVVVHLAADAGTWWVSDALASDGKTETAGWLYFEGPAFETARGGTLAGTATLGSVRSTFGESGTLRFGKLSLTAFSNQAARDPSLSTMPPDGVIGPSGPDFIPMVGTGTSIVGYVATRWQLDLPLNSFRALSPDQPVFASDLRTIVGYSVPGQGFQAGR